MLHTETVEPGTFSILKRLMLLEALNEFSLVGGTALSLRYGHRKSIDIDLFCTGKFDQEKIVQALKGAFKNGYQSESKTLKWGVFCYLNDVKVDIIHHPHPLIGSIESTQNIRMYSDADIIAMKFNAILGRGKKKDFWDVYELMQHYHLKDMISFHEAKFPDQNLLISIPQALTYFDDADESEDPVSLKGQTWESVKKFIQQKVSEFLK
ncbi:MAG: nucleotidyl transferase AbiEii/AbiGii toxin family protein [Ferruginibacter sp.]|nr:nucleotidyl transferase AbiEii/AbiGii toxin family protein [Ferruginibacter sp.]